MTSRSPRMTQEENPCWRNAAARQQGHLEAMTHPSPSLNPGSAQHGPPMIRPAMRFAARSHGRARHESTTAALAQRADVMRCVPHYRMRTAVHPCSTVTEALWLQSGGAVAPDPVCSVLRVVLAERLRPHTTERCCCRCQAQLFAARSIPNYLR
jgi:hypothetical protein